MKNLTLFVLPLILWYCFSLFPQDWCWDKKGKWPWEGWEVAFCSPDERTAAAAPAQALQAELHPPEQRLSCAPLSLLFGLTPGWGRLLQPKRGLPERGGHTQGDQTPSGLCSVGLLPAALEGELLERWRWVGREERRGVKKRGVYNQSINLTINQKTQRETYRHPQRQRETETETD